MPETCGATHPSMLAVHCEKTQPCYLQHSSFSADLDWQGEPPPEKKSRRAEAATIAGTVEKAPTTGPPDPIAHARRTDLDTSHEAAASVEDIRDRQAAVLRVVEIMGDPTDEELVEMYPGYDDLPAQSPSGIRTRRRELVDLGLVVATGQKRQLQSGRMAHTWRRARMGDKITKRAAHSCDDTESLTRVRALASVLMIEGNQAMADRIMEAI